MKPFVAHFLRECNPIDNYLLVGEAKKDAMCDFGSARERDIAEIVWQALEESVDLKLPDLPERVLPEGTLVMRTANLRDGKTTSRNKGPYRVSK